MDKKSIFKVWKKNWPNFFLNILHVKSCKYRKNKYTIVTNRKSLVKKKKKGSLYIVILPYLGVVQNRFSDLQFEKKSIKLFLLVTNVYLFFLYLHDLTCKMSKKSLVSFFFQNCQKTSKFCNFWKKNCDWKNKIKKYKKNVMIIW